MGGAVIIGDEGEDPGWSIGWRSLVASFAPGLALKRAREGDMLTGLRRVFVGMVAMVALLTAVVMVLGDMTRVQSRLGLSLGVILAAGVIMLVGQRITARLNASSAATLAGTYFRRFALRVAFANSVALDGFVVHIVFGPWWVYFCALPINALGLAIAAPTRGAIRRDQDRLSLSGCDVSLVAALRSPEYRARG